MKKKLLCMSALLLIHLHIFPSLKEVLKKRPCGYLEPELICRINKQEVHNVVEIGAIDEINAVLLRNYYQCPTFAVKNANFTRIAEINEDLSHINFISSIDFDAWFSQISQTGIDLLCVNEYQDLLPIIDKIEYYLKNIKYIVINKKSLNQDLEKYLSDHRFRSLFAKSSLFDNALFIHEKLSSLNFLHKATPVMSPLIKTDINSRILYGAWHNDHTLFHNLNSSKIKINYQDSQGNTALMLAAACNSEYPLRKLLQQKGLDVSLQNKNGFTALMIAAAMGNVACVRLLLQDDRVLATVNIKNNEGMTAQEIAHWVRSDEIANLIGTRIKGSIEQINNTCEYPKNIIPHKVLICGTCKDVGPYLNDVINIMEKIGGLFIDYRIVISENNSIDETKAILQQWSNINSKVYVHCETLSPREYNDVVINKHDNGSPFKVDLIARGRNIVLDKIQSSAEYNDYPYLIMIDMDFEEPPPASSIIEVFESEQEWDAIFAYGISREGSYWDWYALRDYNQPLGPELLGKDWFSPKRWSLSTKDQWCKVYSAFGGLGIYKRSSIEGCRYAGVVTEDMEKLFKKVIEQGKAEHHPMILKYLQESAVLPRINIFQLAPNLPHYKNNNLGIILQTGEDALVWRMNSFVWQYPCVVDHMPFHASMIIRGHDKLFINPRLILKYTR